MWKHSIAAAIWNGDELKINFKEKSFAYRLTGHSIALSKEKTDVAETINSLFAQYGFVLPGRR